MVHRGHCVARRQGDDLLASRVEKRSSPDRDCAEALLHNSLEYRVELLISVFPQDELADDRTCGLQHIGKLALRSRKPGFKRKPIVAAEGTISRNNPSRFGSSKLVKRVIPVAFPPGRLKLVANPYFMGSPPRMKTIGMVDVAALAAWAAFSPPPVARTVTPRRTNSAAIAGNRS